jgi:hypothetical protein
VGYTGFAAGRKMKTSLIGLLAKDLQPSYSNRFDPDVGSRKFLESWS